MNRLYLLYSAHTVQAYIGFKKHGLPLSFITGELYIKPCSIASSYQ
ncbi:hypothetical protein GAB14E_0998 [Colwellia psychrerythraea]|uniref:Uncharacterized protein n=1 Tax=Colwellia psychrerythraea TaxID=28229 RepID=A0A099L368_COLPS|nr:hypothetical protein GAB14E_0998 [Colwellia psychrerythraea]